MENEKIALLKSKLESANKIAILTGRGIENSVWFNELEERERLKLLASIPKVATVENLISHPNIIHEWITLYRKIIKRAGPSPLHKYIAELQRLKNVFIITEAVDGMFFKAGCKRVIELYGNIMENRCPECGRVSYWDEDESSICPRCGSQFRPGIVLFGEDLNTEVMNKALDICSTCDMMMIIDSSLETDPIPHLFIAARDNDAFIATIQRRFSPLLRQSSLCIQANPVDILEKIIQEPARKIEAKSPMAEMLASIKIGDRQRYENLEIFPLFNTRSSPVYYSLVDEAMRKGDLIIEEIGEYGRVPQLFFKNKGAEKVLVVEGAQIIGLKQNRIINMSILIKENSELIVPVSCVEKGRWGEYNRRKRPYSESIASAHLRAQIKKDLIKNMKARGEYSADQEKVWRKTLEYLVHEKINSQTEAYHDYEKALQNELQRFKKNFRWQSQQIGFIAFINGEFSLLDIFDKAEVASKIKDKLIQSCAVDAYDRKATKQKIKNSPNPQKIIDKLSLMDWEELKPIGEGQHLNAEDEEITASALICQDTLIHLSASPTELEDNLDDTDIIW